MNGNVTLHPILCFSKASNKLPLVLLFGSAPSHQGNICYIVDKFGKLVVSYNYDAWGNVVSKFFFKYGVANAKTNYSITLGTTVYTAQDIDNLNSHYYRGYYYDKDVSLYYLINRYYDPTTGRFISIDDTKYLDFSVVFGYNRYAYCCNNPVMGYDPEGTWNWGNFWQSVGNFFVSTGNAVYNNVIKPVGDFVVSATEWVGEKVVQSVEKINNSQSIFNFSSEKTRNDSYNYDLYKSILPHGASYPEDWPEINPSAPGWGPNGEYTVWQMVMAIMGSIGMIGSFIGVIISLCGAPQIGVPVWAIGGAIGTLFFALGGFLF